MGLFGISQKDGQEIIARILFVLRALETQLTEWTLWDEQEYLQLLFQQNFSQLRLKHHPTACAERRDVHREPSVQEGKIEFLELDLLHLALPKYLFCRLHLPA
jgi:hypothetical protein